MASDQTRTKRFLSIAPERGGPDNEPVRTFELRRTIEHQTRDRRAAGGWTVTKREGPEVLEDGISRNQLEALVGDAVNWLAYLGDAG